MALLRVFILAMFFASQPVAGGADETVGTYFPVDAWGEPRGTMTQLEKHMFYEGWFGGQLAAMNEPSLAFRDASECAQNEIRLLFLPTFNHGAALRISYDDKQDVSFEFKKLSGVGGSVPGDLMVHSTGIVDAADSDRIFALLETINPWSDAVAPVVHRSLCFDGTQTVLEVRKGCS